MKKAKIFFIFTWILAISLSVYIGLIELQKNEDSLLGSKLSSASRQVNRYVDSKKVLPESLDAAGISDAEGVTYKKLSNSTYELCGTFKTAQYGYRYRDNETVEELYSVSSHKKGYECFKIEPYALRQTTKNKSNINITPVESTTIKAMDTERQIDIKTLHAQIEAYYAQNGYYPTLANMNDSTFRSTNMKGLEDKALLDPEGTIAVLRSLPRAKSYSYAVLTSTNGSCEASSVNCAKYTLTAVLNDGSYYTKKSLN